MCNPVAFAVLGGLQAGAQALGAKQQREAQYKAQLQQNEMQRRLQAQATEAEQQRAGQEATSLRMRQAQEQEAVGRELEQVGLKSQAALARARVSAGESGVAGASVDALMGDYMAQEAGYRSALLRQQALSGVGTGLGLEQIGLASQQRLMGINQPIAEPMRPRGLGIQDALNIASGSLKGYMTARSLGVGGGSSNPSIPRGSVSSYDASGLQTYTLPEGY
jgi:hypothetical protein